jgi:hypothetical protein
MAQVRMNNDHRANRLLAALGPEDFAYLDPHLTLVELQRGQVIYEAGETIQYTYFPHNAVVSLVTVMMDGKSAEMATFGCESLSDSSVPLFPVTRSGAISSRYLARHPASSLT